MCIAWICYRDAWDECTCINCTWGAESKKIKTATIIKGVTVKVNVNGPNVDWGAATWATTTVDDYAFTASSTGLSQSAYSTGDYKPTHTSSQQVHLKDHTHRPRWVTWDDSGVQVTGATACVQIASRTVWLHYTHFGRSRGYVYCHTTTTKPISTM